jgi:dTDP-4-amino-4,6-dideoxygalactose transaminase
MVQGCDQEGRMSSIRLMKPYLSFEEVEKEFREVFETGLFTRGQFIQQFRDQLAEFAGVKHVFPTTSATTALWTCLRALHTGPGDEVVVSDFSFPATANVVEDLGATPVFADVDLDTFNMLPEDLEKKITARTKAVIFVDALGNPTGLTQIKAICEKHGIPLVEDAACAIGSSEHGKRCGGIADMTCYSFHPRKLISTGEGGAITTNNKAWAEWFEVKLFHGAKGMKGMALDFVDYGFNFRLPELQAIMGSKQLAKIEPIIDARNQIRNEYIERLKPLGFVAQKIGVHVRYNVQSMVFKVPSGCDRNTLIARLKEMGVESTIGTYSMSSGTYFARKYGKQQPNSSWLENNTITLPCFEGVNVGEVAQAIESALR